MLTIRLLAEHPESLPVLREWFEAEWPAYYGVDGPGHALQDLQLYSNEGSLPVGLVAWRGSQLCGVAALKASSIESHKHLSPWVAAGLVHPALRGQGVGAVLLGALEQQARQLGFARVYCATSTAQSLLERGGWQLLEKLDHEGHALSIYAKGLV